jgi:hypothetical protein
MLIEKYMRGKLKSIEEIKANSSRIQEFSYEVNIYHTNVDMCIGVSYENFEVFGKEIDVKLWVDIRDSRKVYQDVKGSLYYDEWFEWLGEEPVLVKPLEDDLWDISDW